MELLPLAWSMFITLSSEVMIAKFSTATNRLIMNASKNSVRGLSDKHFSLSDVEFRLVRPDEALKVRNFGEREMCRSFAHLYTTENLSNYIAEAYTEAVYLDWLQNKDYCVFGAFAANPNKTNGDTSDNKEDVNSVDDMVAYVLAGPCSLPISEQEQSTCKEKHSDIAPGEVKRLYAHPSTFGSGIAEKLLITGIDWLKEGGKRADRSVYLGVYSENPRAIRFYEKNNFRKVGEYEYIVGEQRDHEFIFKHQP